MLASRGDETKRLHRAEHRGRPARGTDRLKEPTPGDARSDGPHGTAVQIGQSRQSRAAQRRAEGDLGADESSPLATRWLAITR